MEKILVLMSTYNGERFLRNQLNTIYGQKNVDVMLFVRDDGSKDSTIQILEEYKKSYDKMTIFKGENIGSARSFCELVDKAALTDFNYFAFSDQDDIWHPKKLECAIKKLKATNGSAKMYCSNLNVVDEKCNFIRKKIDIYKIRNNKSSALVQNIASGCTIVFNRKVVSLFLRYKPKHITMHDYWMYLICIYLGTVVFDERAFINYRQHDNNVVGAKQDFISIWKSRIKSFSKLHEHPRELAAQELLKGYSDMLNEEDINIIKVVSEYRGSLKKTIGFLIDKQIKMSSFDRNFWLKIRILFGSV